MGTCSTALAMAIRATCPIPYLWLSEADMFLFSTQVQDAAYLDDRKKTMWVLAGKRTLREVGVQTTTGSQAKGRKYGRYLTWEMWLPSWLIDTWEIWMKSYVSYFQANFTNGGWGIRPLMIRQCWFIGSSSGLVPSGNEPLPKPMLTQFCVTVRRHHTTVT